MEKIYLTVPYANKDDAKKIGAKWDAERKTWYTDSNNKNLQELIKIFPPEVEIEFIGEDRNFGGNFLYVDLIPQNCWFKSAWRCVSAIDWENIKKTTVKRANNICECCGEPSIKSLEVHERFSYDDDNKIQKLERLIALCNDCHTATHMGRARVKDIEEQAKQHLQKVRGFNEKEVNKHIDNAELVYKKRSDINYQLDLSLLINSGIIVNKLSDIDALLAPYEKKK